MTKITQTTWNEWIISKDDVNVARITSNGAANQIEIMILQTNPLMLSVDTSIESLAELYYNSGTIVSIDADNEFLIHIQTCYHDVVYWTTVS